MIKNVEYIISNFNLSFCEKCNEQHTTHNYQSIKDYINQHNLNKRKNVPPDIIGVANIRANNIYAQRNNAHILYKSKKTWYYFERENIRLKVIKDNLSLYLLYTLFLTLYDIFLYTNWSHIAIKNFDIFSRFKIPQLELKSLDFAEEKYYNSEELIRGLLFDCYIIGNEEFTIDKEQIEKLNKPETQFKNIELSKRFQYGDKHKVRIKCILETGYHQLLVASEHTTIKYFSIYAICHETIMKYKKHTAGVNSLALSNNKNYFYSASDDCTVIRWNLYQIWHLQFTLIFKLYASKVNPKVLSYHKDKVIQVMTLENELFCSCSFDKTINFYNDPQVDKESPSLVKTMLVEGEQIIAMYHVHNSKLITISTDKILRFIDYKQFKYMDNKTIKGIECGGYECIRFNKEKNNLIIGGQNLIYCIDLEENKLIYTYENPKYHLTTNIIICGTDHYFIFTDIGVVQLLKRNGSLQMVSNTTFYKDNQSRNNKFKHHFEQILCVIQVSYDEFIFASEGSFIGKIQVNPSYEEENNQF